MKIINILSFAKKKLLKKQKEQQKKIEEYFKDKKKFLIKSFYRNPISTGDFILKNKIKNIKGNKLIMLFPSILKYQDIVQIFPDFLTKLALLLFSFHPLYIKEYKLKLNKIYKNGTISRYIINSIEQIQKELFEDQNISVIIVRNANKEDFIDTTEIGGKNTVLLVGGHGSYGSVLMTNGKVYNDSVKNRKSKLKAFIQHTCAGGDQNNEIGRPRAKKIYGRKRSTSPIDFINNPLNKRD